MWKFEVSWETAENGYWEQTFYYVYSHTKTIAKIKRFFYKLFNFKNNYIGIVFKV